MILRTPHYYKNFKCIADKCNDNCCVGGWQIGIDEETVEYYKQVEGKFGDELRANLNYNDEYCFKLNGGQCPFLDDHNLCRIYQELGEEHMGVVCAQFPRYSEYYGTVKETGIGLACEEAANIIFSDKQPWSFDETSLDEEEFLQSELDEDLVKHLFTIRTKLINMMDSTLHFNYKLRVILTVCDKMQHFINNNDYNSIEKLCTEFDPNTYKADDFATDELCYESINEATERIWSAYLSLETLNGEWEQLSMQVCDTLHPEDLRENELHKHNKFYEELIRRFEVYNESRINEYNNLIKYYLFRYFCKAGFDHDIYGKAQLIICNYLIIRDLDMYIYNKNGGTTFQDRINTVHIFSREIEYSEDNLLSLYEEFLFDDIFKSINLNTVLK